MTIDLGRAEYTDAGNSRQRYFIQLAGAGLDSRSIELVTWELKKKLGPLAYVVAGCRAMREPQPVIVAHGPAPVSGGLVLIGNGRFYGGSFAVFPQASMQDGLLDVCVFPKVKLTSASRVILQLDGENVCELPATLSVRPKALNVIVP
jgi:diacylglycerol kinase family enzyme